MGGGSEQGPSPGRAPLPRPGHWVQRGVRAGGPPFQGGAPPHSGATAGGGRVRAGAPPQGACAPSALTFRSLSDSRNISFTTSLVSAARTVCIVAFVQRVWERHGGTRSETCRLAARPGPSVLAVRLGWGLTPPERPASPSALRPGCSVDPGAQEAPRPRRWRAARQDLEGGREAEAVGGRRGRGPGLPAGTPGPAPPWAWGKDRPQQEGKQGPSPKSGRTRSLAQGQQGSTGQTHVQWRENRSRRAERRPGSEKC